MENLGKCSLVVILSIIGFFISLLLTYIILSIANLYQIDIITRFSFIQIFGLLYIINLVRYKYKKSKEKSFIESMKRIINIQLSSVIIYLLLWGMSYIAYYIIK